MHLKNFYNVFVHKIATRKHISILSFDVYSPGKRENVFIFGRVTNTNA